MSGILIEKEIKTIRMHRGKSMERLTQGEDNHPQAMELGLRGNQPY